MLKRLLPILILLLIIAVVWLGSSLYLASSEVEIDSKADTYIQPIQNTIDTATLEDVIERSDESLLVSPQVLKDLENSRNNSQN